VWDLNKQIQSEPDLVVLDVRQPQEWSAGHIEGAMFITGAELPSRLDDVPGDRPIAVVCGSGYRSSVASSLLANKGFTRTANVLGGMTAWKRAGFKTTQES
jgi:hydroxyacylglutathione hydrolase